MSRKDELQVEYDVAFRKYSHSESATTKAREKYQNLNAQTQLLFEAAAAIRGQINDIEINEYIQEEQHG